MAGDLSSVCESAAALRDAADGFTLTPSQPLEEGIAALDKCLEVAVDKNDKGRCFLWRSILGSRWAEDQSLPIKYQTEHEVKPFVDSALEILPHDPLALHTAAMWHFRAARTSWWDRAVATRWYAMSPPPPESSYETAADLFEASHQAQPTMENTWRMADCYRMMGGKGFEAHKYFYICCRMRPTTPREIAINHLCYEASGGSGSSVRPAEMRSKHANQAYR